MAAVSETIFVQRWWWWWWPPPPPGGAERRASYFERDRQFLRMAASPGGARKTPCATKRGTHTHSATIDDDDTVESRSVVVAKDDRDNCAAAIKETTKKRHFGGGRARGMRSPPPPPLASAPRRPDEVNVLPTVVNHRLSCFFFRSLSLSGRLVSSAVEMCERAERAPAERRRAPPPPPPRNVSDMGKQMTGLSHTD